MRITAENGAYANSFQNNPGLCTSDPSDKLRFFVLASVLVLYMICAFRKKNNIFDPAWKLTPFRRSTLTESDILSGLNEHNVIGSGGSGKVYRVPVSHSSEVVAVKKICNSRKLEHHLEKEFLIYGYMANRSLNQWLHQKRSPLSVVPDSHMQLDWPKRLNIAIRAAQGLSYMHHGCLPQIIHRDSKSSNVLIDSDFNAKIADFGLARTLITHGEAQTMSTVAGSFDYLAPEYGRTHQVNEKIDIYSFGVILLELTMGKEANDAGADKDVCLAKWAWRHVQEDNSVVDALDPDVRNELNLSEMVSVFKLETFCTGTFPSTRPSMKQVAEYYIDL